MDFLKHILITILILGAIQLNLLAKDYDTTHEKPEVTEPDNHRIYFRYISGLSGVGSVPETNTDKFHSLIYAQNGIYVTPYQNFNFASDTFEVEYRFKDRFRFFYDKRDLFTVKSGDDKTSIPFVENQKRLGLGYFHPVHKFLNLGVSLRDVIIKQNHEVGFIDLNFNLFRPGASSSLILTDSSSKMHARGIVPGIHLEFKPLRWFEIHLSQHYYYLHGQNYRNSSLLFADAGVGYVIPFTTHGDFVYKGTQDRFDFVFRYSSWFATRWGATRDRMQIQYKNFYFGSLSQEASLLYSGLGGEVRPKFDVYSVNFTVEFSKSFGSN
ncbi:hypothetical protein P3G55_01815 [Leptospira sp. 96542]|nr:hypothetical protein [Leptospira sp. 96542]